MSPPLYPTDFRARTPKPPNPRRNRRLVTMPEKVGPLVRLVFAEMARLAFTYDEVEEGSGVRRASMKAWRRKNAPGLASIEAVLGFLGYSFVPVPRLEVLPPEVAGELVELARKIETDVPTLWSALVDVGVEQKLCNLDIAERRAILADRDKRKHGYPRDRKRSARLQ